MNNIELINEIQGSDEYKNALNNDFERIVGLNQIDVMGLSEDELIEGKDNVRISDDLFEEKTRTFFLIKDLLNMTKYPNEFYDDNDILLNKISGYITSEKSKQNDLKRSELLKFFLREVNRILKESCTNKKQKESK